MGARSPHAGLALIALFALSGALRSMFQSRWLMAALAAMTVAGWWVPWMATAVGAIAIGFLFVRITFVIKNLRLVVAAMGLYAVLLLAMGSAPRTASAAAGLGPLPVEVDVAGHVLAFVVACVAGCAMSWVLGASYRRGYTTARALEVMSILPLLIIASVLPFLNHETIHAALDAGELPRVQGLFRLPPALVQAVHFLRAHLGGGANG
jgi:hypothetical protein